jgi:hypothetical protein
MRNLPPPVDSVWVSCGYPGEDYLVRPYLAGAGKPVAARRALLRRRLVDDPLDARVPIGPPVTYHRGRAGHG